MLFVVGLQLPYTTTYTLCDVVVFVGRSHSTGSLVSVADSVSSGGGLSDEEEEPKLEEYIEMVLTILIILNVRRKKKPTSGV